MATPIIMGASGGGGAYVGEHTCGRVLPGEIGWVTARLVFALEQLGYGVISDHTPVQAKRAARKDIVRADFLDHARRLTVALRSQNNSATHATFDFAIQHGGFMTKGDHRTLEREVDAIIAVALASGEASVCAACGAEGTDDSRFCRACGAPVAAALLPAEVEVMRLTAGARGSLQEVWGGALILLLTMAVFLPLILFGSDKAVKAGWVFFAFGQLFGWLMLLYGTLRLRRTLNSPESEGTNALPSQQATPSPRQLVERAARGHALPPASARWPVTDHTTELLDEVRRVPDPIPLRRRGDTDPIV